MDKHKLEFRIAVGLVIYVVFLGIAAALFVVFNFPVETTDFFGNKTLTFGFFPSPDQGLLMLAMMAGIAGSFLHTAQSLSTFLGNGRFEKSWFVWYLLRPWIGGILGLAVYAVFRAGLVPGDGVANPYGVVSLGILGGWFSKTTTDKLQEVYNTLFKTDEDKNRKDKLDSGDRPLLTGIVPSPVPRAATEMTVTGCRFVKESIVLIDGDALKPTSFSATELKVALSDLPERPASGREALVQVLNPKQTDPLSKGCRVKFE